MVALTHHPALVSLALAALTVGGCALVWWSALRVRLPLLLLAASLLLGQAIRFPVPGQGGGLLSSDLAVLLILFVAIFWYQSDRQLFAPAPRVFWVIWNTVLLTTIAYSGLTLLFGVLRLHLADASIIISALYWLRLVTHLLLFPALIILFTKIPSTRWKTNVFVGTTTLLLVVGFLQFFFFSNFASLAPAGWDPHRWRLTSTWLDPNFFAAFILLAAPFAASLLRKKTRIFLLLTLAVTALLATKSRSGFLAGLLAAGITTPLLLVPLRLPAVYRRRLPAIGLLIASLSLLALGVLAPRLSSLFSSDPTATLRWRALNHVHERLLPAYGLLGSGYNTYQFAAARADLITDFTQHSRAGADNSWLTIWATTGLPGLFLFATLWISLGFILIYQWLTSRHLPALAAFFGLLALTVHSQIVNSFLYSHLLITLAWVVALTVTTVPPPNPTTPHKISGVSSREDSSD